MRIWRMKEGESTVTTTQREHIRREYGDQEEEIDPSDTMPLGKAHMLTVVTDAN